MARRDRARVSSLPHHPASSLFILPTAPEGIARPDCETSTMHCNGVTMRAGGQRWSNSRTSLLLQIAGVTPVFYYLKSVPQRLEFSLIVIYVFRRTQALSQFCQESQILGYFLHPYINCHCWLSQNHAVSHKIRAHLCCGSDEVRIRRHGLVTLVQHQIHPPRVCGQRRLEAAPQLARHD